MYIDSEHYDAKTYTQHCGEEKRVSRGDITMYRFTRWRRKGGEGKKKTQVLQKRMGRTDREDSERTRSLCVRRFKGI